MAEQIEVLDQDGNVLGVMDRVEAEANDLVLPNVVVFIFNSSGKTWLGKRPSWKKHYPNMWDTSACGGLLPREDPLDGAHRELLEEMGFDTDLKHVKSFLNEFQDDKGDGIRRRFTHIYVGSSDQQPIPNDEVAEYRLFTPDEIRSGVADNPKDFIPSMLVELDLATSAASS